MQENELNELREVKKNYDKEIKSAIETTKSGVVKELETRYKYESQLKEKDSNSKIELLKQTIESLNEKLNEKNKLIESMQKQVSTAHLQTQELAKKEECLENIDKMQKVDKVILSINKKGEGNGNNLQKM